MKPKAESGVIDLSQVQLSYRDPLTGVWNRRKYDQTIAIEWLRCLRNKSPITLILMDLDYFKQFNDSYGHMAGDECLIKIGEMLKNSFSRASDMVVRYGGEEFIVLLPDTGKEEALIVADKALYQAKDGGKNQIKFLSE